MTGNNDAIFSCMNKSKPKLYIPIYNLGQSINFLLGIKDLKSIETSCFLGKQNLFFPKNVSNTSISLMLLL